ncbi:MAG: NUDIX hydrolase [Candidatus Cohnella colombiensis]|uniref:NUDIX hydrolase n=1 Tax=Candidatus Cohnella colombiensis TaxID=3121368 RepID=A0AA95EZD1_9BACL|nr:MAG: NUDIX hydrolase [Cohnella sp.]
MSDKAIQEHPFYERTLDSEQIFQGRVISLQVDTVSLPNGESATREIVRHPGAVAVLALVDNKMLVVEQFRKPLEKLQVEIPAGKLDQGEEPVAAAARELEEETGYRAKSLQHLSSFSTSPGFADEIIHLYFTNDVTKGDIHLDDDEFLTCEAITLDQAISYIDEGRICDSKTLLAVYAWRIYTLTGSF